LGSGSILPEFLRKVDLGAGGLEEERQLGGFNFAPRQGRFALSDFCLQVDGVLESLGGGVGGRAGLVQFGLTQVANGFCSAEFQAGVCIDQLSDGLSDRHVLAGHDKNFGHDPGRQGGGFDSRRARLDPTGRLEQRRANRVGVGLRCTDDHGDDGHFDGW
jgi:hypothetical protein